MKSNFEIELKEDYLQVVGSGERNSLTELIENTRMLTKAIEKFDTERILADYRKVKFNISFPDIFNVIKSYDQEIDESKNIKAVIVINSKSLEIVDFWKELGRKRNYNFEVFLEMAEAENWLLDPNS